MRRIALLQLVAALCFPLRLALADEPDAFTRQLLDAVDKNDPKAVAEALAAGAPVNSPKGPAALFEAVDWKLENSKIYDDPRYEDKACAIVDELLKHGADINAIGPRGKSVFQEVMDGPAILTGEKVTLLLADHHPDVTYRNAQGQGVVAMHIDYACAQKFIAQGAPFDEPDRIGVTPLMMLAQAAMIEVPRPTEFIKFLLAKGADPERKDREGKSAIDRAVSNGDYDLLLLLDAKGRHREAYAAAKQRVQERQLESAVSQARYGKSNHIGNMVAVEKLLNEGVDPNVCPDGVLTIFGEALIESTASTKARQLEVVAYLLDHGADPNRPANSDGSIPLELATHEPEIFALLLAHGAKLNRNLQLAQAASPVEIGDIQEAVFRHQFGDDGAARPNPFGVYFLSITDKLGKQADPSTEFLERFAGGKVRVAGVSHCTASADKGVRDIKTGEVGLIYSVDSIRWISETKVEVSGGYYAAGLAASGNTYTLEKKDGKWVVVKDVMNWIS